MKKIKVMGILAALIATSSAYAGECQNTAIRAAVAVANSQSDTKTISKALNMDLATVNSAVESKDATRSNIAIITYNINVDQMDSVEFVQFDVTVIKGTCWVLNVKDAE